MKNAIRKSEMFGTSVAVLSMVCLLLINSRVSLFAQDDNPKVNSSFAIEPTIIMETSTIRISGKEFVIMPETGIIEISSVDELGKKQRIATIAQYFKSEFSKGNYILKTNIKKSDIEYNEERKEFKESYELLLDEAGKQHCVCT